MTNSSTPKLFPATEILAAILREAGPVGLVRLSSAQSGAPYPYWGAPRYELALTKDGHPAVRAQERADSERRSRRLAERDAQARAHAENRIYVGQHRVGSLRESDAERLLTLIFVAR
jgi:hypothetical protein